MWVQRRIRTNVRRDQLIDGNQSCANHWRESEAATALKHADHVDANATALFQCACNLILKGIVAKKESVPCPQQAHGSRISTAKVRIKTMRLRLLFCVYTGRGRMMPLKNTR